MAGRYGVRMPTTGFVRMLTRPARRAVSTAWKTAADCTHTLWLRTPLNPHYRRTSDAPSVGTRTRLHQGIKAGTPLERTIIDDCVWQPERQDYVGPPELVGVERNAPEPFLRTGPMLTLADVRT